MLVVIVNCSNLDTDTSQGTLPLPTEKNVHNREGLDSQMLSAPFFRLITENAQVTQHNLLSERRVCWIRRQLSVYCWRCAYCDGQLVDSLPVLEAAHGQQWFGSFGRTRRSMLVQCIVFVVVVVDTTSYFVSLNVMIRISYGFGQDCVACPFARKPSANQDSLTPLHE